MIIAFVLSVVGSLTLSIWAAKLLWKNLDNKGYGYIPFIIMLTLGGVLYLVYDNFKPSDMTSNQYIILLYIFYFLCFVLQLNATYRIVYKHK